MKKLLAVDYGTKRIGLAISSVLGTIHPRPRLDRTTTKADVGRLALLAAEEEADAFLIGLPHHMDGEVSDMEVEARAFAARLAEASGLPVYGTDERLTSQQALRILKRQHRDPRKRKERVDSAAACLLLQDFLAADSEPERIA